MDVSTTIPELALVVLIGPSGSGKSTFAQRHFLATEIVSSDYCRGVVSDDESSQTCTKNAFELLHFIVRKRLASGRLTVVDATNLRPEDRRPLISLAKEFHCIPVAIVLEVDRELCIARNRNRTNRNFGPRVVIQQLAQLRRGLRGLKREGFRHIHRFASPQEIDDVTIQRTPLYSNKKTERGPFDIIGDLHGCASELERLLDRLGYEAVERRPDASLSGGPVYSNPQGRKVIFLGDLGDRGPRVLDCFRVVYNMVKSGNALCVPGNHDLKLYRYLRGNDVQVNHGLEQTIAELEQLPVEISREFRGALAEFIYSLVSHYVLDEGRLVVAHAGMKDEMQGRGSGKVREFALYGETTGETDEFGLPIRYNWAAEYRGQAAVVYGHTPVPTPQWFNRTINIDTGCVFGGSLTALRYPEQQLVSVPAATAYFESVKPFPCAENPLSALTVQHQQDDLLDIQDVLGKRIISTRLRNNITIRQENSAAALEVISRFAVNPKWLIHLPSTMSPTETSKAPCLLEHPAEAFSYFQKRRIETVICQEKHMGSRVVVVLCRDEGVARDRFGVVGAGLGACYTRTGRSFFDNRELESEFLERVQGGLDGAGVWDELQTNWICLDCELMPWSAKAQELLKLQYAAVGAAAMASLPQVVSAFEQARNRGCGVDDLKERHVARLDNAAKFVDAFRRYCWPVGSINDLRLAPFHVLASEGAMHSDKNHCWHLSVIGKMVAADQRLFAPTLHRTVELENTQSVQEGIDWWIELTNRGGEGMVIKPTTFVAIGKNGLLQPALKCRGPEYLRIIYGPDYLQEEHLVRLRNRFVNAKRSLAIREFALGIESLERFVRREPLRRVHECVFGVLALESEPVDPRL